MSPDPLSSAHRRHEGDFISIMHPRGHPRVLCIHRHRHRLLVLAKPRPLKNEIVPDRPRVAVVRHLAYQLAGAREVTQACEQPHGHAHAMRYAFWRAATSSGSAVAPSSHTSPPSKSSRFPIGTIRLTRSNEERHAA